jgi:hypothetical protein
MQLHPELTTALLVEHGRDLYRRAEQRRTLSRFDRRVPSGPRALRDLARRALMVVVPRPPHGSDAPTK